MRTRPRNRIRRRTHERLIRIALRRWDTDKGWRAIAELQERGSPRTLLAASQLASSTAWRRRSVGLYIASQLMTRRHGQYAAYALEETQALLLKGLFDPHQEVVQAAVSGLGHRPHPAAETEIVRLSSHPNDDLRFTVAVALAFYETAEAISALLRLMTDRNDEVRDWATFSIGTQHEADTAEIRDALWRNLHDANDEVRGEALVGLAQRHDQRAVAYLLEHLTPECRVYELDAAEALADPTLLEALRAIKAAPSAKNTQSYWFSRLRDAIRACESHGVSYE